MKEKPSGYLIGLDYGTESARGILLDAQTCHIEATHTHRYRSSSCSMTSSGPCRPELKAWLVTVCSLVSGVMKRVQAGFGDTLAWFVRTFPRAERVGENFASYNVAAASLRPGQNHLVALDWWNGNRVPAGRTFTELCSSPYASVPARSSIT
jgi:ribulose kinase